MNVARPVIPTLPYVGTAGLLADGPQVEILHQVFQLQVARTSRRSHLEPVRLGRAREFVGTRMSASNERDGSGHTRCRGGFVCIVSQGPAPSRLSMLAVVAVPVQLVGQLVAGACSPEVDKCILDLESGRWFRIVESESVASKIPPRVSGSTSVEKALRVCEVLSAQPDGQSVTELARELDFPPSTTHRLLALLRDRGYVRQDDGTSRYRLTLKGPRPGFSAARTF